MERVVEALNLNYTYYAKGKIKELNVYKSCPFYLEVFELADSSKNLNLNIHFTDQDQFTINGEKNVFSFGQILKDPHFGVFRLIQRYNSPLNDIYRVLWTPTFNLASSLAS